MPEIQYPTNPNSDTAFVVQEDGTKNRALMTAPQDTSTLELPSNANSTKGYVTIDGKKQRVILTADLGGGGGGSVDYSKTVQKTSSMPVASADNAGQVYMYTGATDANFTQNYIYKNVKTATYTGTVSFEPATLSGTTVACSGDNFANFLTESGVEPLSVVSGTMTYDSASSLWVLVGKDSDGNTVLTFQEYQQDFVDAGFTFTGTPQDGDVVAFTCTVEEASATYAWTRVDVQPAGSTYTAGTGISIDANNEISVDDPVVTNSATQQTALAIGSISNPATASSGAYWAAAVGANASVTAADGVAVGANTSTTAADGVAIGPGATVTAAHAIQISSWDRGTRVTNSVANTVNIANGIANYRVLEADGSIPADRLTHAINKYSTMPTAGASNEGWIVQFTGTTDATYTHGYIYECKAQGTDPETYAWEAMTVQAGGGGGSSYTAGTGIDITNDVISTKVSIAYDPANSTDAVAVMNITGGASPSDGDGVLVIGNGAKSNPRYTTFDSKGVVVIGESANAGSTYAGNSVTIGNKSAGALNTVVIGYGANTSSPGAVAIGKNAKVSGSWGGLAIGQETTCGRGGIILNGASNSQGTATITGTSSCFDVVLSDAFLSYHQYTLLNGAGLIPADRLASTTGLADGNYRLRLVMASGVPTLEWVAE